MMTNLIKSIVGGVFALLLLISVRISANAALTHAERMKQVEEIAQGIQEGSKEKAVIVRPQVRYEAGGLRDPFQPPIIEQEGAGGPSQVGVPASQQGEIRPPELTVQGIIWGGKFPQAIINNKVIKEGDLIDGVKVLSITKNGISIFHEGNQYRLSPPAAGGAGLTQE